MRRLQDRVAVVFGAGSSGPGWGNGKAAAVLYAREGAVVIAVDRVNAAAAETAAIICDEGGAAGAMQADATDEASVAAAIEAVLSRYGRIDVLHNNIGIGQFGGPVELPTEDWQRVMDANLKTAFLTCKYALPAMERQCAGVIINISSIAASGIGPYPYVAYCTSKAGLNQFTRAVAVAYAAQGIRCNALLPGVIETPMAVGSPAMQSHYGSREAMLEARHSMSPTGRMGTAWDVAHAAVFLASDEARYINGVLLPVDGGLSCRMG